MTLTVLQIIPAMGTGGAEQACVDIAQGLVQRGDRALIMSTGGWRVEQAEKIGARHILHDFATKNPAKIIRNAMWLAAYIRENGVDIVHVRSRAPAWSAKIACNLTGCPFITTFHAAYKFTNKWKKVYNRVMASADRVIAISPFIAAHIKEAYGVGEERVRLINRGIDTAQFDRTSIAPDRIATLKKAWGVGEEDKVLLLPARLTPIKGHAVLIEALSKLKREGKPLPLVLFVGDDQGRATYTACLKDLIETAGLAERVKLVGMCNDMPAAYALAHYVAQPSQIAEGFGRVPVEAMAMGLPVLASDIGGMRETVVAGETGWLLPVRESGAWAKAVEEMMAMTDAARAAMAEAGCRRVARYFSQQAMVAQTLLVYDEVIRTHP